MSFNFEFLDKIDILAATGQFWPKFWLRGTRQKPFLAIAFERVYHPSKFSIFYAL